MPQYSKCWEPGCNKTSYYNYEGRIKALFCGTHADLENGMINVKSKRCECGKQAHVDGFCVSCARKDGWDGTIKNYMNRCKSGCGKFVQINSFCVSCAREDGWDGVKNECRNKCGKQAAVGRLCTSCHNEQHGIVQNIGEDMLQKYLKEQFCLKTQYYIAPYQIDFLIELEELLIVIEHDENQHKDKSKYPIEREAQREEEILKKLMEKKRTVFIRFSPSNFTVDCIKVEVPLEDKFNMLGEFIEECISDQTKTGIFRLFYDE